MTNSQICRSVRSCPASNFLGYTIRASGRCAIWISGSFFYPVPVPRVAPDFLHHVVCNHCNRYRLEISPCSMLVKGRVNPKASFIEKGLSFQRRT